MQEHKKMQLISSISSENELREELIIPLFRKMEFSTIDNQGTDEYGTDVILKDTNKLGISEYTSIVLKKGDIDNKSGAITGILKVIREQVFQAAKFPIEHPEIKKDTYPNKVWLVTNGKISNNAKSAFHKLFKTQFETLVNIEYLDKNQLVVLIDKYWPEFYNDRRPFLSQYADRLREDLLDIKVSDIGDTNKNINDVLIPQLLIEKKNIDEVSNRKFTIEKRPILPIQILKNSKNILIISGEAGAGKSTLLKRLAIEIAEEETAIPIVISAKKLPVKNYSLDAIYENINTSNSFVPYKDIKKELTNSKTVLLVDGLDEIRSSEERELCLKNLKKLQKSHGSIEKIIISTRPESNSKILTITKSMKTFQVHPVQNSQVTTFFSKWFGSNNKSKANKLFKEITKKSLFDKLPKTPLTLTLLAILYESRDDLPTTLTELYRMFSELLLGKLDNKKGINPIKDNQVKVGILSYLAWNMHKEGEDEISQEKLLFLTSEYLLEKLGDEETDPRKMVQNIIERSGLLVPSSKKVKFRHLSFQEYFCARHVYCKKIFSENLSNWIEESWWDDVLFFSAGSLKNLDDHVDILINNTLENKFSAIYSMGGMLQAAYETSTANKQKIIKYAKNHVPEILEEVREELRLNIDYRLPQFIPYAIVIDLLTDNYSSGYLNISLEKEIGELNLTDESSSLKNLFIAAAMAKSNNITGLESISTSPEINSPVILLLSDMLLDQYDEKFNKGKVTLVHKKVKKKIKDNEKAVRSILELKKI